MTTKLDGVEVLIDGYNLELVKGTGIKTYGISLIKALNQLGANVDILFSREVAKTGNPTLDEVLFFDVLNGDSRLVKRFNKLRTLKQFVKGGLATGGLLSNAMSINTQGIVLKSPVSSSFVSSVSGFIDSVDVFNLANCYQSANVWFALFGRSTKVSVPKNVDIFHATYPLPVQVKGAKKLTTVHDLIPLRLPYTTLDNKRVFYKLVKHSIQTSNLIITVSEHSKKDILTIFDADPDKICVTYQPITLKPLTPDETTGLSAYLKKFGLKPKNYVLFVGAIEPKKNVGRLVDAYVGINTRMPLVIAGKRGWLWKNEIGKVEPSSGIKLLEYVSVQDLRYLYTGAKCFVFPSFYEGFGLPPLEAMSFGCPVITSQASSLPEICGNAALYVDPYDIADIREKLETLLGDESLCNSLSASGKEQAQLFSLDQYLKRLTSAYSKCL